MPCFKGFAVSIHTPQGPLPEYSIQKQSRQSRITTYIPVPPPKLNPDTSLPEGSTFAISITLLTPGLAIPYSKPAATPSNPLPAPKFVGALPGSTGDGHLPQGTAPYVPLTDSPNETVAAYIHFDGRAKEEVATLLRRGVETWVNSRWVSVADTDGGGLAEREFLFREVGLERWLNGLDLQGQNKDDAAAKIQRRKERLERKRRKRSVYKDSSDEEQGSSSIRRARPVERFGVLRYGESKNNPVEGLPGEDEMFSTDSSEDEMPEPEASGQIKISLFRVLASGEIKRGEYSPQFDAHDDDEGMQDTTEENGDGNVDHTTGLAKPKTLDPKTISTQTVTGIDPPDKPFATFTFFYRGEKQLRKMGVIHTAEASPDTKPASVKRKTRGLDFAKLEPLKSTKGTVGFSGYRDAETTPSKFVMNGNAAKTKDPDDMESDDEDDKSEKKSATVDEDGDVDINSKTVLSQEELARRGELAEGVKKMQLKRHHSEFDPSARARDAGEDESNIFIPTDPMADPSKDEDTASSGTPSVSSSVSASRLNGLKSDPIDPTDKPRAPKKHRASSAAAEVSQLGLGFLPSSITENGNAGAAYTSSLSGANLPEDRATTVGLNGVVPAMPPASSTATTSAPVNTTAINDAQRAWEDQAKLKDANVTAFVGGDNGQSATIDTLVDVAAKTALPDEGMDEEL